MKSLNDFARVPLAILPTPIQKLENISRILGTNVWIKRDDMTGIGLGGNKVRKLEFLLAEAKAQGAEVVFTDENGLPYMKTIVIEESVK